MLIVYADGIGTGKLLPGANESILFHAVGRLAALRATRTR